MNAISVGETPDRVGRGRLARRRRRSVRSYTPVSLPDRCRAARGPTVSANALTKMRRLLAEVGGHVVALAVGDRRPSCSATSSTVRSGV